MKLFLVIFVALLAAAGIVACSNNLPYEEQLIRLQAEQTLGSIDRRILEEPISVQALLLDYVGDGGPKLKVVRNELVMKGWIALLKYPVQSRDVLQRYGSTPEFKQALRDHGEFVVPVIKYFLDNDLLSLRIQSAIGDAVTVATAKVSDLMTEASDAAKNWWNEVNGTPEPNPRPAEATQPTVQPAKPDFGPNERGWYAIHSINSEGNKFLSQFHLDAEKAAHWNQVDRTVTALSSFLVGGLSNLETKYELNEKIAGSDVFFAAIDVIPFVVAVKLLKAGKLVSATGKELSLVTKTRLFAGRLIPKSAIFQTMGKYGVLLATGYVVLTHPGLLNSVFSEIADLMGLSPTLVQFLGWFLLISAILYPFLWVLKFITPFLIMSVSWLDKSIR